MIWDHEGICECRNVVLNKIFTSCSEDQERFFRSKRVLSGDLEGDQGRIW